MAMAIVYTELLMGEDVRRIQRDTANDNDDDRAMPQQKEETTCHG